MYKKLNVYVRRLDDAYKMLENVCDWLKFFIKRISNEPIRLEERELWAYRRCEKSCDSIPQELLKFKHKRN